MASRLANHFPNVRLRTQELAALNKPGVGFFVSEKAYQKARQAVIKKGNYRRVLSKAGEWYDDFDSHSRCG